MFLASTVNFAYYNQPNGALASDAHRFDSNFHTVLIIYLNDYLIYNKV